MVIPTRSLVALLLIVALAACGAREDPGATPAPDPEAAAATDRDGPEPPGDPTIEPAAEEPDEPERFPAVPGLGVPTSLPAADFGLTGLQRFPDSRGGGAVLSFGFRPDIVGGAPGGGYGGLAEFNLHLFVRPLPDPAPEDPAAEAFEEALRELEDFAERDGRRIDPSAPAEAFDLESDFGPLTGRYRHLAMVRADGSAVDHHLAVFRAGPAVLTARVVAQGEAREGADDRLHELLRELASLLERAEEDPG